MLEIRKNGLYFIDSGNEYGVENILPFLNVYVEVNDDVNIKDIFDVFKSYKEQLEELLMIDFDSFYNELCSEEELNDLIKAQIFPIIQISEEDNVEIQIGWETIGITSTFNGENLRFERSSRSIGFMPLYNLKSKMVEIVHDPYVVKTSDVDTTNIEKMTCIPTLYNTIIRGFFGLLCEFESPSQRDMVYENTKEIIKELDDSITNKIYTFLYTHYYEHFDNKYGETLFNKLYEWVCNLENPDITLDIVDDSVIKIIPGDKLSEQIDSIVKWFDDVVMNDNEEQIDFIDSIDDFQKAYDISYNYFNNNES